jgi:serine/threonine-protein kinase HipA
MAMAATGKNRHYHWKGIQARHWIETAKRQGIGDMKQIVSDVIARTPEAIDRVRNAVPADFPAQIADAILRGIETRAEQLKEDLLG